MNRVCLAISVLGGIVSLTGCQNLTSLSSAVTPKVSASMMGPGSSGGGDNLPPDYGSAWFLGTKTIRYCYVTSSDFGVTAPKIEATIERAFSIWQKYAENLDVLLDMKLDFNRTLMPGCDGSEDLKFYLGVSDSSVEAAKGLYVNPAAFSYRSAYDDNAGWGKGFVWLGNPSDLTHSQANPWNSSWSWDQGYALEAELLHELGHVYGNAHVSGTIMREDISQTIMGVFGDSEEPTIDGERILVPLVGDESVDEKQHCYQASDQKHFDPETFQKFVGQDPEERMICTSLTLNPDGKKGALILLDDGVHQSKVRFAQWMKKGNKGPIPVLLTHDEPDTAIFKVAKTEASNYNQVLVSSLSPAGHVFFGSVTDASGKTYPAVMTYNMNDSFDTAHIADLLSSDNPIQVIYFDEEGGDHVLYGATSPTP